MRASPPQPSLWPDSEVSGDLVTCLITRHVPCLGCVYYEGDCFAFARNPYISVEGSNPTGNHSVQRRLVGEGLEERKQALEEMWEEGVLKQVPEAREKHYKLLCKDILQERSRIGGI